MVMDVQAHVKLKQAGPVQLSLDRSLCVLNVEMEP